MTDKKCWWIIRVTAPGFMEPLVIYDTEAGAEDRRERAAENVSLESGRRAVARMEKADPSDAIHREMVEEKREFLTRLRDKDINEKGHSDFEVWPELVA